jgi:hypothetical protein
MKMDENWGLNGLFHGKSHMKMDENWNLGCFGGYPHDFFGNLRWRPQILLPTCPCTSWEIFGNTEIHRARLPACQLAQASY